jgi:HSP90 family molecular chaperone
MMSSRNSETPERANNGSTGDLDLSEGACPIKLSSKTLVHISSGLYRNTANALKELVSNSFDADAHVVHINTNYPEFDVLTCSDDGDGMELKEFIRLMDGGIGDSMKRVDETDVAPKRTKSGRPVIGRIGIGMLAIAQVCFEF